MANYSNMIKFIEKDGNKIPYMVANHEDKNGNPLETGENNPLPSGQYVQNNKGVWLPVSADNPVPIKTTGRYVGDSKDNKPTDAIEGQEYVEMDTKDIYVYDGTNWRLF